MKKEIKKRSLSELVFILDKSGSMSGKEEDVIGGFNSTIKEHKDKDYDVFVTTVLFSNKTETVHDRIDIKEIMDMTDKDYRVGGCTALIDAMGETIKHIKDIHKYQRRKEDVPEHTMFVIMTDGLENASHMYTSDEVKKMVEEQKKAGWDFIFLGANIDAVETAKKFSIDEDYAVNFIADKKGIAASNKYVQCMSSMVFSGKEKPTSKAIKKCRAEVDKDFEERKNK